MTAVDAASEPSVDAETTATDMRHICAARGGFRVQRAVRDNGTVCTDYLGQFSTLAEARAARDAAWPPGTERRVGRPRAVTVDVDGSKLPAGVLRRGSVYYAVTSIRGATVRVGARSILAEVVAELDRIRAELPPERVGLTRGPMLATDMIAARLSCTVEQYRRAVQAGRLPRGNNWLDIRRELKRQILAGETPGVRSIRTLDDIPAW